MVDNLDEKIRDLTKNLQPGNDDAVQWAEAFVKVVDLKPEIATDEGAMISWFANAIETRPRPTTEEGNTHD